MKDLEKRYEVISRINGGTIIVMYFSKEVELTQDNITKLVCKILEANQSGIDIITMETKINEYILQ